MMINNNFTTPYGYSYGVPRPQARNTQPLTSEQIAKLRQESSAFDMRIDQEDLWRAACTHKEKNGANALIDNGDGTYTCSICHATFEMCDSTKEDIEKAVKTIENMLQTSKTIYLDIPEELARQYYQLIPLLKKFPMLWSRAIQNFSMYEGSNNGTLNPMSPGYSGFNAITTLLTNPYNGFAQQPQYNPYQAPQPMMAQPYGYQQPMGMQVDPSVNPMAYGAPAPGVMPGMAPTAPMPGVMPGVPQPAPAPVAQAPAPAPAAPAAPAQQAEVQQQQVFNV